MIRIEEIEKALRQPLPGKQAQYIMAPPYRPDKDIEEVLKLNPKIGGVLVLLNPMPDSIQVVFTLRRNDLGAHSGQMSFAGGKQEDTDTDLTHTALRETHEEIGIAPEQVQVLGKLTEIYIPPSNFLVYPTVGVLAEGAVFAKQETEVAEIVQIPLDFFLRPESVSKTKIKIMKNHEVEVPAYNYEGYIIWGATAIMMSELVWMLNNIR